MCVEAYVLGTCSMLPNYIYTYLSVSPGTLCIAFQATIACVDLQSMSLVSFLWCRWFGWCLWLVSCWFTTSWWHVGGVSLVSFLWCRWFGWCLWLVSCWFTTTTWWYVGGVSLVSLLWCRWLLLVGVVGWCDERRKEEVWLRPITGPEWFYCSSYGMFTC